jgi:hypothetical protein
MKQLTKSARYYKTFMDFQRYRHFINPARVNPKLLTKVIASDGYLTTLALANENLCLCLSLVYVAHSRLLSPHQTAGDKQIKSLDCIFHSYEWERATSLLHAFRSRQASSPIDQRNHLDCNTTNI